MRRPAAAAALLVATALLQNPVSSQNAVEGSGFERLPGHVRIVTWNVGDYSIFPKDPSRPDTTGDDRPARVGRVLRAVDADVVCLQEVNRPPALTVALMQGLLPREPAEPWAAHRVLDNVVVSRFPILGSDGGTVRMGIFRRAHAIVLVDLPPPSARDLTIVCAHFQSRAGLIQRTMRQRQADMIAAWIRNQRTAKRRTLPPDTPLVILGDLNVVDSPSPSLRTLLTGDISDEREYGRDIKPDWDGSDLLDVQPRHRGSATETYTWRDDSQRFMPGVLDRVLLTDSIATPSRAFVVNTTIMSADDLRQTGLRRDDVMLDPARGIHDHLPIVVDLAIRP
jgi:endonuclease/exonuclease/phosphatase family metal-dependent hydrolase